MTEIRVSVEVRDVFNKEKSCEVRSTGATTQTQLIRLFGDVFKAISPSLSQSQSDEALVICFLQDVLGYDINTLDESLLFELKGEANESAD